MKIIFAIACVYCLFIFGLFVFQRSLMYAPDISRPNPSDRADVVTVDTADNISITSSFISAPVKARKTLVFFHGNAGNHGYRAYKAVPYVGAGYDVLLAEYRGYGGNAGHPSEQGLYSDARAQIKFIIEKKGVLEEQIILYGESIGSGVAVQMATEYPDVHALILETPFSSMVELASAKYSFAPVGLLLKDRYMSIDKISSLGMPVFIGHGKLDQTVPYSSAQKLYERARGNKNFVSYDLGGHNNLYDFGFADHVLDFLSGIPQNNIDNKPIISNQME